MRDIAERKQAADQLTATAATGLLTGLANRTQFQIVLTHALNLAKRDNTRLGVLYLDIDQLKLVNDSLGHAPGDDLLRQATQRLRSSIRQSVTIARVGSDEFAIDMENFNRVGQLIPLAGILINAFAALFYQGSRYL